MTTITFNAPWSKPLRIRSAIAVIICLIAIGAGVSSTSLTLVPRLLLSGAPIVILGSALLFSVRGYTLTKAELIIKRFGWTTRLPLRGLKTVEGNADAWHESIRIIGNNGLFAFTGWHWSKRLKFHRYYATDPSRAVVLRYANKTIVITPHDPQHFIVRARTFLKTADFPL